MEYGVIFYEIFSLEVKMITLWFLLKLAAVEDFELLQLDVKMVFFHGDLDKELYMEESKGFVWLRKF